MGKHDHPTLQMEVKAGHLVPLTPYEAEVLSTYSNGAVLTVEMNQKRSLPLLKKYWVVLRDVVSNCKTPWNSPDEASDALKLALGVTDVGKTVSGQWFIRAGSISFTSMDQAAFKDFFDKAMAVLAEVTGIDPDELSSRYRHLPEHEPEAASPLPASEGSDGNPEPQTPPVAAGPSEADACQNPSASESEAGEQEAADGQTALPASQSFDEPQWLRELGRVLIASIGPETDVVINSAEGMKRDGLSEATRDKARSMTKFACRACGLYRGEDPLKMSDAVRMIKGIAKLEDRKAA